MNRTYQDILVKVFADAPQERIVQSEKKIQIYVREPARGGVANRRVQRLLADYYHTDPQQIIILRGRTTPNKIIRIYT